MAVLFRAPRSTVTALLRASAAALVAVALTTQPAAAQDEEDWSWDESDFDDIDEAGSDDTESDSEAAPAEPTAPPDDLDFGNEDDELDDFQFLDGEDDGVDLLGGQEEPEFDDNAVLYRRTQERAAGMSPEEEVELWEAYLRRYENSAFEGRIRDRIDEIIGGLYDGEGTGPAVDALDEEIDFSQGLNLEIINPRTTIQGGFEWGLPDFGNIYFGYDHQLARNLAIGGSIRRRYTGFGVEASGRYALIKSTKTNTLVTAIATAHLNFDRTFLGVRPMIAAGKRFGDRLDVQAQLGTEFELTGPPGVRFFGGANVTYKASDTVAMFLETSGQLKNITFSEGRPFNFTVLTFGLQFMPQPKGLDPGQLQVNIGANVPYATSYYMYHFGSIMAQINYYPQKQ